MNEVLWDEDFDVTKLLDEDSDYQSWLDGLDCRQYNNEWYHANDAIQPIDILWSVPDAH